MKRGADDSELTSLRALLSVTTFGSGAFFSGGGFFSDGCSAAIGGGGAKLEARGGEEVSGRELTNRDPKVYFGPRATSTCG
jgi:hypothetical protein